MGSLLGGMMQPNSALMDPNSGRPTAIGSPAQILASTRPMLDQDQPLPTIGTPSYQEAAHLGGQNGAPNALSPALTKGGKLATLLTSGLQGALAGRGASEQAVIQSGGRRSGGAGMGFEAGYTLPWQRAMQGQQLQQAQAQTGLTQAEQSTVNVPGIGPMPSWLARTVAPAAVRAQGQESVAQTNVAGRQGVANTQATSAANVAQINKRYMAVPGVGLYDTQSKSVIPGTAQGVTITPEMANDYGLPNDFIGKPMNISQLTQLEARQDAEAPKVTTRQDVQTDANGNLATIPVTSTTTPQLPKRGPQLQTPGFAGPQRGTVPQAGTAVPAAGAKPVTSNGAPIQSASGAAQNRKWVYWTEPDSGRTVAGPLSMANQAKAQNPSDVPTTEVDKIQSARQVVNLITKQGNADKPETQGVLQLIDSLDKDGKLGIVASRMEGFLSGKVGTTLGDDPRIISLFNKADLAMTKSMQAHFGASGGRSPQMLQHFLDLANAKKMDAPTLRSAFKALNDYMSDNAMLPTPGGAKQQGADPVAGLLQKYAPQQQPQQPGR